MFSDFPRGMENIAIASVACGCDEKHLSGFVLRCVSLHRPYCLKCIFWWFEFTPVQ